MLAERKINRRFFKFFGVLWSRGEGGGVYPFEDDRDELVI